MPYGRWRLVALSGNALMLLDDAVAGKAAPFIKRQAFGRRVQRDGPRVRRCQQRIHQPGTVATALGSLGDDDHPG